MSRCEGCGRPAGKDMTTPYLYTALVSYPSVPSLKTSTFSRRKTNINPNLFFYYAKIRFFCNISAFLTLFIISCPNWEKGELNPCKIKHSYN